jgi:hypothetical protein
MELVVDVDRCLSMLASLMGGTFTPVKGDDAPEGTLLSRAHALQVRFRSERWPDFLREIDARITDPALEQAYLDFLGKLLESPADGSVQRTIKAWIRARTADHPPAEAPLVVLSGALDITPKKTLDVPHVRYEEFGLGILSEGFKPDADLIERLIRRMGSGEATLDEKSFATLMERIEGPPAQKQAWTERAAPFFRSVRDATPLAFSLEAS